MKFITYPHQAWPPTWKGNQFLSLDVRHTNGFPCQSKGDANNTDNQCIFEEVGVWRESIAPARRLKAGTRERKSSDHAFGDAGRYWKNYRKLKNQQGSKMDVSGKKEQRKEIEVDESWLKLTHESNSKYRR